MDVRIKVAWMLNGSTYIAAVCMILFKCWPLHRQWQIYPDPGSEFSREYDFWNELTFTCRSLLPWSLQVECDLHYGAQYSHRPLPHDNPTASTTQPF